MKRAVTLLVWALAVASPAASAAEDVRTLVAVASDRSQLAGLKPADLRLAFLALPVGKGDARPRPVINQSNPLLYEVFLQKVVFLSSQHYQRQMVSHVFQRGGTRPAVVDDERRVVQLLHEDPQRISFMWAKDAQRYEGLKVVRVLWQGPVR
ncbi:hypothetical protein ACFFGH_17065 [Lysobacter korlensis]|uniref:Phosphate ABC transporter substrate-binding protein n=1 Tax=Lysobacter korlensis TaxID=553636 RepID=A0ABV6RRE2_9GAMM